MRVIKTPSSNHNFMPPKSVTDGSIGDLPCEFVNSHNGRVVYSVWEPTDDERRAIARGQNIKLGISWIGGYPPTSLGITDEQEIDDLERIAQLPARDVEHGG